jgi:predicted DNA-binding antitoxin AbrB/MazE fold protein
MTFYSEATFENGVLKLDKPVDLSEGQRVRVIIHTHPSRVSQWPKLFPPLNLSAEDLEYLAEDPDNAP